MCKEKIFYILILCFIAYISNAQGCVAIRSNGATCTMTGAHDDHISSNQNHWTLGVNTRYFKSYKHFVGKVEQHEREEAGSEVINYNFSTDLILSSQFNSHWSIWFLHLSLAMSVLLCMNIMAKQETTSFDAGLVPGISTFCLFLHGLS